MDGEKTLGIGILIWLATFAAIVLTSYFGLYNFAIVKILIALFSGYVAYNFSTKKILHNFQSTAVGFGVAWTFIGIFLDGSVTYHFLPDVVSSWGVWLGHVFTILVAT
jgi:hypothetical protein